MDFVLKPPVFLLVAILVVGVVAVLALLLKQMPRGRKIAAISIVVVVCAALPFFLYRTTHLVVDDQGIRADTYGRHDIAWTSVQKALVVDKLGSSPYALTMRTNGSSVGDVKKGWFKLANGNTAFVTTEIPDRALVMEAQGATFILAPLDFDSFLSEVARHVTVTREAGGAS